MGNSEKFCLKWNDFRENVNGAFESLRKDTYFTDVTLACEDGHQVEAHKVILAASSPFFQNVLQQNKHPHPLIYMRGMNSNSLISIVNFLYFGEINIYHENLDDFLNIAEELNLKGMTGGGETTNNVEAGTLHSDFKHLFKKGTNFKSQRKHLSQTTTRRDLVLEKGLASERTVAFTQETSTEELKELEDKIKSLMRFGDRNHQSGTGKNNSGRERICNICGKVGSRNSVMAHIESNHIDRKISRNCTLCEKTFITKASLTCHQSREHKQK